MHGETVNTIYNIVFGVIGLLIIYIFGEMREISWLAAEPISFSRSTLLHGVS